ncbi:TonB-dependent siderophore receptor [Aliarcobacter vitoriensis]|uniref:TonB-dependent siderophore receptor n=1 Tax=Aliarcobacter vitoriensis TaxID=2011099 RepID=UPI003AB0B897
MNLSLKETPQSVSVITSKRMEDQQLNTIHSVLKNTTGVIVDESLSTGGVGETKIFSRGYQIKNFQVDGSSTTVFTNHDTTNGGFDTAIYDSVSVVRGATGLLTGAGDPSGSVNLVRKKPTKDFQASLEAQTGRWDKYRGVVDIGGGFNEDGSIRGRFIASYKEGGFYIPEFINQTSTLYGVLEADLSDYTTLSATWEHTDGKHNAQSDGSFAPRFDWNNGHRILTNYDKYTWIVADWVKEEQTNDNLTLALTHHINDYWKIDTTYNYLQSDGKAKYFDWDEPYNTKFDNKGHTIDLKLNGGFELWGQTHELVLGFNGSKSKSDGFDRELLVSNMNDRQIINNKMVWKTPIWGEKISGSFESKVRQYGAFISTKLNFTDDFSAILGGRYSEWKDDFVNSWGYEDHRKTNGYFLPYLALTYDITENLTTYASYTEIFNPQSTQDKSGRFLEPETGFNYEIGLKGEWFDGRLNSSIALFQSGKDNLAVTDKDSNGNCYRTPTGDCASKAEDDTKNRGWEFEIVGEITPNWQVQFGFSSSILKDSAGNRLNSTLTPIRTANLFTTYKPISKLTLGGGLRWQSETSENYVKNNYISIGREDMVGEATQKDYYVVDLMANYEFNKNLNLLVNINNSLNKEYKNSFRTYSYGDERNWMATLKYKF